MHRYKILVLRFVGLISHLRNTRFKEIDHSVDYLSSPQNIIIGNLVTSMMGNCWLLLLQVHNSVAAFPSYLVASTIFTAAVSAGGHCERGPTYGNRQPCEFNQQQCGKERGSQRCDNTYGGCVPVEFSEPFPHFASVQQVDKAFLHHAVHFGKTLLCRHLVCRSDLEGKSSPLSSFDSCECSECTISLAMLVGSLL